MAQELRGEALRRKCSLLYSLPLLASFFRTVVYAYSSEAIRKATRGYNLRYWFCNIVPESWVNVANLCNMKHGLGTITSHSCSSPWHEHIRHPINQTTK
jgi:hypothetical protein